MLRLASSFVPNAAVAEEVVQDTWIGVLRGMGGFEGRSSFRPWLFRILVNRARTAGERERRPIAVGDSTAVGDTIGAGDGGAAVPASRFDAGGSWLSPPERWIEEAEDRLEAGKLAGRIRTAVTGLPRPQRQGWRPPGTAGLTRAAGGGVRERTEGNAP